MYVCMSKLGGGGSPEREIFIGRVSACDQRRGCLLHWSNREGRDFFFGGGSWLGVLAVCWRFFCVSYS